MIIRGIDTIEFGLDIEGYSDKFKSFLDTFSSLKDDAQITGVEPTIDINGLTLTVHRTGKPFYPFRLSCNDFIICFMDKEMKSNPPISIRFISGFIWSYGLKKAYEHFLNWFSCFDTSSPTNKLSRADICADSDEVAFYERDIEGVITRARKKEKHYVDSEFRTGRRFSGFSIGKGSPLSARIYDKTLEIKTTNKYWFCDIWRENAWNKEKDVWRVEFQIRREVLKELKLNSIEDLLVNENELWSYLTQKWLTIRQPSRDNVSRWPIKRKWRVIQEPLVHYQAPPLIREVVKEGNIKQLLDQAAGLLISVAAINNDASIEDTVKACKLWAEVKLANKNTSFDIEKEIRRRKFMLST